MTQRDELLGRLKELHTGTKAHRATSRVIRAMIFDGDYAGATTALDTLEDALHPALAGGGGGIGLPFLSVHHVDSRVLTTGSGTANYPVDTWVIDHDDLNVVNVLFTGYMELPAGFYLVGGYVDLSPSSAADADFNPYIDLPSSSVNFPEGDLGPPNNNWMHYPADSLGNAVQASTKMARCGDGAALSMFMDYTIGADATYNTRASLWAVQIAGNT